ncbi:DUF4153 domain-containing protein [Williamsia soli]|uniref:DUF4153 domain-containing protein n=1 Tax=Williamsia soli TaxID=364929 RepID=UPI001A9E5C9A|nr:DUF4173 domain-containing protein [Williamsia soli]
MPEIALPQAPPVSLEKKTPRAFRITLSTALPGAAPSRVLAVVALVALSTPMLMPSSLIGIGIVLIGIGVLTALFIGSPERPTPPQLIIAASILALLMVAGWRSAEWLSGWCILLAVLATGVLLIGGRSIRDMAFTLVAPIMLSLGTISWLYRGAATARAGKPIRNLGTIIKVSATTVVLLVVFGALFAGADATFASLLSALAPDLGDASIGPNIVLGLMISAFTALGCYLRFAKPQVPPRPHRPVGDTWTWAVPTGTVLALYVAFLLTQARAMFGGDDYVQRTADLTYAEYARSGFWQLFAITALTIVVVSIGWQRAARNTAGRRALARTILGGLCLCALAVVMSALHRMDLYMDAFGATRLRMSVLAAELWLGAILVILIAAGFGLGTRHLPRVIGVLTIASALGFAVYNPDHRVAQANVDRFEKTGKIDLGYLSQLSPDATGALLELPADLRRCVLRAIARDVRADRGPMDANIGRAQAKEQLQDLRLAPVGTFTSCGSR